MRDWNTLDPQARSFLEAGAAAGTPPVHQLSVADARRSGLAYLDLQRPVEDEVAVEHRFISGPTADLPVRIYRANQPRPSSGSVLMLHGSGWVICNLDVADVLLADSRSTAD